MLQFKCSFANSFTLIIFFLIHTGSTTEAATPTYISHFCDNSTSSSANSSYSSNLETLLLSLSSYANHVNDFYYATAGRKLPNVVFGLFLCRGDVSNVVCQDCVNNASKQITKLCPTEKDAIIWYEECLLRYSDEPIFAIPSVSPAKYLLSSINNVTENDQFELLLASLINTLAAKAVNIIGSGKKFATGKQNFSDSVMMYGLVQCTPDLSEGDCSRCFREAIGAIPSCCSGKQSVKLLLPSCFIMYDSQPFYNETLETPPPPDTTGKKKNKSSAIVVAIVVPVAVFALLCAAGYYFYRRRARKKYDALNEENVNDITTIESVQYEIKTIETATDKFSEYNKLGRGGFGEVYKGILVNGREIAVKRLSKSSGQGAAEFKNEVALVAKLQHRNLVRLLGFCLEGEEKILVYEYVANKSLDYFLFDPTKQGQLNWSARCNIIEGIARGILYLHEDSRLKIIHRDLKASNILLDKKMNAKVADFGMAKMFGVDQTQGNTRRIVGTYGYMAPEYAMEGLYSVKSDVFSFGVLLLEILSGRRNTGFHLTDCAPSLVAYAWQLWNEEKCLELMDLCLKDSSLPNEFIRYVHIGLLCVQEDATKRPTMSSVALMLKSEAPLAQPERPAFFSSRYSRQQEIIAVDTYSANGMTVSDFLPR